MHRKKGSSRRSGEEERAGEEHPITYISRKLLPNERNYSTAEKEAIAVKWTLDRLRYYLLRREFTFVTDHEPLRWMAAANDTNAPWSSTNSEAASLFIPPSRFGRGSARLAISS